MQIAMIQTRKKLISWTSSTLKDFCPVTDTFKRTKRKQKKKKVFANQLFDKGFLYRLYEELSKFNKKKTNSPAFKKWAKDLSIYFTKEDILTAHKYIGRYSNSKQKNSN